VSSRRGVVLAAMGGARLERSLASVAWARERIVLDPAMRSTAASCRPGSATSRGRRRSSTSGRRTGCCSCWRARSGRPPLADGLAAIRVDAARRARSPSPWRCTRSARGGRRGPRCGSRRARPRRWSSATGGPSWRPRDGAAARRGEHRRRGAAVARGGRAGAGRGERGGGRAAPPRGASREGPPSPAAAAGHGGARAPRARRQHAAVGALGGGGVRGLPHAPRAGEGVGAPAARGGPATRAGGA
jgi:hypothetical protein